MSEERSQLHTQHLSRRDRMQSAHKQLLMHDLRQKMEKVESVKQQKQLFVEHNSRKNLLIRDMTIEAMKKHDQAVAAQTMDFHYKDWQIDVKRQKALKKPEK